MAITLGGNITRSGSDITIVKEPLSGSSAGAGTATSATASTLTDSSRGWTSSDWIGRSVYVHTGTGAGQTRYITANTGTQLTVFPDWDTTPSTDSQYQINYTFDDIQSADSAGGWGVIATSGRQHRISGRIILGDDTTGNRAFLADEDKQIEWPDAVLGTFSASNYPASAFIHQRDYSAFKTGRVFDTAAKTTGHGCSFTDLEDGTDLPIAQCTADGGFPTNPAYIELNDTRFYNASTVRAILYVTNPASGSHYYSVSGSDGVELSSFSASLYDIKIVSGIYAISRVAGAFERVFIGEISGPGQQGPAVYTHTIGEASGTYKDMIVRNCDYLFGVLSTASLKQTLLNPDTDTYAIYYKSSTAIAPVIIAYEADITVLDASETAISGATVKVYEVPRSCTITRSGTTASLTRNRHEIENGDYIVVDGADQPEYNGLHQVTGVTSVDVITFTVSGSPATTATGTITFKKVGVDKTTNGSGQITTTNLRHGFFQYDYDQTEQLLTPHKLRVREYNYKFEDLNITYSKKSDNTYLIEDNNFITQTTKATVLAYSGISIDGKNKAVSVTTGHTLNELYDYCQAWASDNYEYDVPMDTAEGNSFTMPAGWNLVVDGAALTGSGKTILMGTSTADFQLINGGSSNVTIRDKDGTFVTLSITAKDTSGVPISGARALIMAASGGYMPYQDSVTIVRSGSTATVTHTAHGFSSNDYVGFRGADQPEYNGVKQLTVTGVDTYTFTVTGTPASPATGTITATAVLLTGLSDVNGSVTQSKIVTGDQPISGWVRKGTEAEAVTQTLLDSGISTTNANTFDTASISPGSDKLIIVAVTASAVAQNDNAIPTLSGCGITWVQIDTNPLDSGWARTTVFRGMASSPSTGVLTFDWSGLNQDDISYSIHEFANVPTTGTSGSDAIAQVSSTTGTGASAAHTMAVFSDTGNATLCLYGSNSANSLRTHTPGTGFTELTDLSDAASYSASSSMWRNDIGVNLACTSTGSVNEWALCGIEIVAASIGAVYKQSLVNGTLTTNGFSATVLMVTD